MTTAYHQACGLVLRRLPYCSQCMTALADERRPSLPLELRGSWLLDFDELRSHIPEWVANADAAEKAEVGRYIDEVARFYRQTVPTDIAAVFGGSRLTSA